MKYAEGTTVPAEKTLGEIRSLLTRHGATHWAHGSTEQGDMIQFGLGSRFYRFTIDWPVPKDLRDAFIEEGGSWGRANRIDWKGRADAEWRRRWRARLMWLKAQLEYAEDVPLAEAMLANLVLPDGRTFGAWATPQIGQMYEAGQMPPMLGPGTEVR